MRDVRQGGAWGAAASLWLLACSAQHTAEEFEIALETASCDGTCPVYELSVRETGAVRFTGQRFVWKPGTYEKQITAARASKVYERLLESGFLGFRDSYGCRGDTDEPLRSITLRTPQGERQVLYESACNADPPELSKLRSIERQILEAADVQEWLEPNPELCAGSGEYLPELAPSYVLRDADGRAQGLLRVTNGLEAWRRRSGWSAVTCRGAELASGESIEAWDCGGAIVPSDAITMRWPGTESPQSAVLFKLPPQNSLDGPIERMALTLFTQTAEHSQIAERADECD